MLTLKQIAHMSNGQLLQGNENAAISNYHFDSRKIEPHALFIALTGGARDGHLFIEDAVKNGAVAAFISKDDPQLRERLGDTSFIFVEDTEIALQTLAKNYRKQLELPIIAITGSSGKTTTKDMVAHLLAAKLRVYKTYKNFNNHLGLPLSLLHIDDDHEVTVLELGMNQAGEIDFIANIAKPNISIITNIGDAHIEFFGTREKIAEAKAELIPHTDPNGYLLLNDDDPLVKQLGTMYDGTVYTYSVKHEADVYATNISNTDKGTTFAIHIGNESIECSMPMFGLHNVSNVLPGAFIARKMGCSMQDIAKALTSLSVSEMRFQLLNGPKGSIFINDAYNASPASMKAAIDTFATLITDRQKVVVLGDMYELGSSSERLHREVGEQLEQQINNFKSKDLKVITVGEVSSVISELVNGTHVPTKETAKDALQPYLTENHIILFKAARGMAFETLVEQLMSSQ